MYTSNREYKNRYGDKYEFVGTDSPTRFILEADFNTVGLVVRRVKMVWIN